jgi:RNA polymerase sigma-70 factor, ECF subfamily
MALAYSEQEFTDLIEANRARIARLCRVYAKDEEDRKDLFQEIVYQLWEALPRFEGKAKVDTFLYRVAVNTALTHLRRGRRRETQPLDTEREVPLVHPDWSEQMDQQARVRALHAAIERLNELDQTLILLYLEELSYQAMADILGLTVNYVGVRLNRAKKRLKALMLPQA